MIFKKIEELHHLVRGTFNSLWDTPSETLMEVTQWDSVYEMYKLSLVKLFYNIASDNTPYKHSIQYRGAVLWTFFSNHFNNSWNFKQFSRKVKRDPVFKELNFNSLSVQSVPKRLSNF